MLLRWNLLHRVGSGTRTGTSAGLVLILAISVALAALLHSASAWRNERSKFIIPPPVTFTLPPVKILHLATKSQLMIMP